MIRPIDDNKILIEFLFNPKSDVNIFIPINLKTGLDLLKQCLMMLSSGFRINNNNNNKFVEFIQIDHRCAIARHQLNLSLIDFDNREFSLIHLVMTYRIWMRQSTILYNRSLEFENDYFRTNSSNGQSKFPFWIEV